MTPKTQSVCKHCPNPEMWHGHQMDSLTFYHPFEPVAEPASTGEPRFLDWVREKYSVLRNPIMLNYGDSLTSDNMKGIDCVTIVEEYARQFAAARPSEPSAPPLELPGPTGEGSSGHSWVEPAPQTSAEPRPEDFRCCDNGNFGTLHDCQKSNPSAPQPADAPKYKHKANCLWATELPTGVGHWGCDCGLDKLLLELEDYEFAAPGSVPQEEGG